MRHHHTTGGAEPPSRRPRAAALAAVLVVASLAGVGCVEQLQPKVKDGDVVSTKYGSAKVELVQQTKGGPIYKLTFSRCDSAMASPTFDPVTNAGAPRPPSLQGRWIWSCQA